MAELDPVVWTEPKDQEVLIDHEELHAHVKAVYRSVKVSEEHAQLMADLQVETDVRGVHSHGTRAAPGYVKRMLGGHTNPVPEITVTKEGPAFAIVDNDRGMGHLGGSLAMEMAIEKAKVTGVAIGTVVQSRHFGAAFNYAMMAAKNDMIGIAISSSSPGLAPWGGAERMLGNNPVAYAVPAGKERPLVLDMASGVSAWGRIGTMRLYGKQLTNDWVLDKDGKPTTDPNEAGILLPFGGVKGSGLAIMNDILASVLPCGIATPHRWGDDFSGQQQGSHFFQAIDIKQFQDLDGFKAEIDQLWKTVREARPREGHDRVYLPGEIEWLKKEAWIESGIPMHEGHVKNLNDIAEEMDIPDRLEPKS